MAVLAGGARRRFRRRLSRHPPAGRRAAGGDHQRAAGLFEGRDAGRLPRLASSSAGWRAGRRRPWFAHISFISPHPPFIVPAPYNTMYDPDDGAGLPPRGAEEGRTAGSIPMSATSFPTSASTNFVVGAERQGQRLGRGRVPPDPRDLLRHDLGGRCATRPRLGSHQGTTAPGTTRSSSSPRTMPR